jgi:GNAT superfamily N-acetyltransferase
MKVIYRIAPPVTNRELNALFADAWPNHRRRNLEPMLRKALIYVCAHEGKRLVGFAKVISDGGVHGFLLDPTVAPDRRRRGIGRKLVEACAREARRRRIEWLHVDFEPRLAKFYLACGFSSTRAALRNLKQSR